MAHATADGIRGRLCIIGERDLAKTAHRGIERSLELMAEAWGGGIDYTWLATDRITAQSVAELLGGASAVWCTPGSPYASTSGALLAIAYAREHDLPFLGTCGGFQHALMEYATNVLGHAAEHEETSPTAEHLLINRLSCSLVGVTAQVVACDPAYAAVVDEGDGNEEFHCNYGLMNDRERIFSGSDLAIIARDAQGQARAFRVRRNLFHWGTLFQPERQALRGTVHPIVRRFLTLAKEGRTA